MRLSFDWLNMCQCTSSKIQYLHVPNLLSVVLLLFLRTGFLVGDYLGQLGVSQFHHAFSLDSAKTKAPSGPLLTTSKNMQHKTYTSNINPPPYFLIFRFVLPTKIQQNMPNNNKSSAIRQASCTPNPTAWVRLDHRREAATRPSTRPLRQTGWLRVCGAAGATATGAEVPSREWLRACRGRKKSMATVMAAMMKQLDNKKM